ncbi:conserved exported hypothetical protein [uncultured Eubacteriales bacterium]|uniref:Uncharacterized protein n=1 Tax=uncultured Eubacteriales bacterium TaxID=172733 RepID=A0A212KC40_9FIRM|nr:conserved exported hypothetical protein [uncultured Eubacteriales bacterium]
MKKRILALLACLLLCVSMAASLAFVAIESEHNCIGEGCQICTELQQCKSLLQNFACALAALAFFSCAVYGTVYILRKIERESRAETPVTLKVKLLI